jgi:hypothetical protein
VVHLGLNSGTPGLIMADNQALLVHDLTPVLLLTQRTLAKLIGSSRSTIQRFHAGRARLSRTQLEVLAGAVYPQNRALAARAAALAGTTLQALGLEAPPPPPRVDPPPPPPSPPLPPPLPPSPHIADSVLCAAAEAMNLPPQAVRAMLRAAFVRARELGLTVETVAEAFECTDSA